MSEPEITRLEEIIRAEIAANGPIGIDRYMALCLAHPEHGYYRKQDPLGLVGDFVTAPEISQIFGELIGLWLAQCWVDQGAPTPFALVELGPGRGTLMSDALRAASTVPGFRAGMRLHLVETSPVLRGRQAEALRGYEPTWLDAFQDAPDLPLFLAANEFFDALPIRQFMRAGEAWRERMVGVWSDRLDITTGPLTPDPALSARMPTAQDGDLLEICAPAEAIAAQIGARLTARGGAALIVDYGYDAAMRARSGGADTFQAMRGHVFVDPLDVPGEADLTAHVDFDALAAAAGAIKHGIVGQGAFLKALGAEVRAEALAASRPDKAEDIRESLRRLTAEDEMGTLFKAMALTPEGAPAPPGFSS